MVYALPNGKSAPSRAPTQRAPTGERWKVGGGGGGSVEVGRNLFNTNCSHCHGPDAASPDQRIDLRRLSRRYHEDKDQVFDETIRKGRPDKGMPPWGGVLADGDIVQIKAYIDSVQMK